MRRLRPPGLESLFLAAPVLFGFRLGARPISDNSTFVHLRTGHDLVAGYWTPRPLLFGLLALAATVTVVERRRTPWLLVPVVWIWVNSHGSFPLGLAYVGGRAVGEWFDDREVPLHTLRCLGTFAVGLAVSALNPLGPRLLAFPFVVEAKRDVFKTVVEWHSPDFQSTEGTFALLFLVLALVILFRRRVPWRDALPVVGFVAFGLLAFRNVPAAGVVLAPALGRALRVGPRDGVGAREVGR